MRCICLRLQKTSGPEPTIFKCMSTVWTPREMRRNITQAFAGTASINYNTLRDLKESVAYWRQFIPEDGLTLDQLLALPIMKKDI